jgi:hypothetical protein
MIAVHPAVSTVSEPWLLLPLILSFRDDYVYSSIQQKFIVQAFNDFIKNIPEGKEAYYTAVRNFAIHLYTKAADSNSTFFIDKTPRYHLIAEEIIHMFPDSPIILLWRNPLAIVSSCINTWGKGRWNVYRYRIDLFHGLATLIKFYKKNKKRIFSIQYEDLVDSPDEHLKLIFKYIGLPPNEADWEGYKKIFLSGMLGDKSSEFNKNPSNPINSDKWRNTLSSPLRRIWSKRYLRWIGKDDLFEIGYDYDSILSELKTSNIAFKKTFSDLVEMMYGNLSVFFEFRFFSKKRKLARKGLRKDLMNELQY